MSSNRLCPECQIEMIPVVYAHTTSTLESMERDGLIKLASCVYLGWPNRPTLFCKICRQSVWQDNQSPQNFIDH